MSIGVRSTFAVLKTGLPAVLWRIRSGPVKSQTQRSIRKYVTNSCSIRISNLEVATIQALFRLQIFLIQIFPTARVEKFS